MLLKYDIKSAAGRSSIAVQVSEITIKTQMKPTLDISVNAIHVSLRLKIKPHIHVKAQLQATCDVWTA